MTRAPTLYTVHCLPGMLTCGRTAKTFNSVMAFDGYVSTVRALGLTVTFDSPTVATITKAAA